MNSPRNAGRRRCRFTSCCIASARRCWNACGAPSHGRNSHEKPLARTNSAICEWTGECGGSRRVASGAERRRGAARFVSRLHESRRGSRRGGRGGDDHGERDRRDSDIPTFTRSVVIALLALACGCGSSVCGFGHVGMLPRHRNPSRLRPDVAAACSSAQEAIARLSVEPASSLPAWVSPTASMLDQPRIPQWDP